MNALIYSFFLLGSFPVGYAILRTAFPSTQFLSTLNKVAYGYVIGGLIFGSAILISEISLFSEIYFIISSAIIFTMLFIIAFAKRSIFNETDASIQKEKRKRSMPDKISNAKVTIAEAKKIRFEEGLMIKSKKKENNVFGGHKTNEDEKNRALAKLREFAQQITGTKPKEKEKKSKLEEPDEIEEELLNNLSDVGEKESEEEEY